jgi:hypothetical protein
VIINKVLDIKIFLMVAITTVAMSMANLKGLESILGQMVNFMKVNGLMDLSMDQECGKE